MKVLWFGRCRCAKLFIHFNHFSAHKIILNFCFFFGRFLFFLISLSFRPIFHVFSFLFKLIFIAAKIETCSSVFARFTFNLFESVLRRVFSARISSSAMCVVCTLNAIECETFKTATRNPIMKSFVFCFVWLWLDLSSVSRILSLSFGVSQIR